MILVIDNYDSFTYNLVQYLGEMGEENTVVRNDAVSVADIQKMSPSAVIISPGPCTPKEAGISVDTVLAVGQSIPLLGVCLGHQCIGSAFGGSIVRAREIVHGRTSAIHHDGKGIFRGIPNPFTATRYHSLVIDRGSLPDVLEVTAWTDDGTIMAVRHRSLPSVGVQFHPESFATEYGRELLQNFLKLR